MPRIIFVAFDGTEHPVDASNGLSLMEAARDHDVPGIEAECGGVGSCATCHVYIDQEWAAVSGAADRVERELLEMVEGRCEESRLSCQIDISHKMDGLIVRMPESQGF